MAPVNYTETESLCKRCVAINVYTPQCSVEALNAQLWLAAGGSQKRLQILCLGAMIYMDFPMVFFDFALAFFDIAWVLLDFAMLFFDFA